MIQTPDGNWVVEVQGKQYIATCQRCGKARQYSDVVTESLPDLHRLMTAHDESHKNT